MSVSVRVSRTAVDPHGPAPTFTVRTDRALCEVQIATSSILFTGAVAGRRSRTNFASVRAPVRDGIAVATPDAQTWAMLSRFAHLPFRAVAHDGTHAAPVRTEATVGELDYASAPTVYITQAGRAPVRLAPPLSAQLQWLRVRDNRIEDEAGDPVVLRGVVRDGMATTERGGLDPTGVQRTTSREVAGITQAQIVDIVRNWGATVIRLPAGQPGQNPSTMIAVQRGGANVIRLPINQEWVLTRPDYVASLDKIITWAAAEGAYTLLALERLDLRRSWDLAVGIAPLPEENTVRAWTMLANRYRDEAAVLYELYAFPHRDFTPRADLNSFERPPTEAAWIQAWHGWVRRLAGAIQRENGRALLFVPGWNLGRELASFPVLLGGGQTVTAVYAVSADAPTSPNMPGAIERLLAAPALPRRAPVFVSRWGGGSGDLAWGNAFEGALRARHRFTRGAWPGVCGWTAGSWGDDPSLVERASASRVEGAQTLTWRTFVMDGSAHRPTAFGELVRGALRTEPFAVSSGFDATRPFGQRSRLRVTASVARRGDFFVLRGHDLPAGTMAEFKPGGGRPVVAVAGTAIGGFMLLVDELPATVPLGPASVTALRPDGVRSDPVALRVLAGPPVAQLTLMPGAPLSRDPYTIVLIANPCIESQPPGGRVLADPIHAARAVFTRSVGTILEALFGFSERLLRDYAHEIRVVVRFATAPQVLANALCREAAAPDMDPVGERVSGFLRRLSLSADICFALYGAGPGTRTHSSSEFTIDDTLSASLAFDLDGHAGKHFRSCTSARPDSSARPGLTAQAAPPSSQVAVLHEFLHAVGESSNGALDDLYDDGVPVPWQVINKKELPMPGGPIPLAFKTLDGRSYASAQLRDGPRLPYRTGAMTFHPERIVPAEPNVMDDYSFASDSRLTRLDKLSLRFLRDRLEWKLGR